MELERLAVDLRPRTPWEALDLGAAMLREWWGPILRVALVLLVPWVAVLALAFEGRYWIALLLLWWSKPVLDRFVLHVASRAVFGELPTTGATLAAWREILTPGLLWQLTLGRPGLRGDRSFTLPVRQLERQTGKAARARSNVLGRRAAGTAFWLTLVCAHLEAVIMLSLGMLVTLLTPPEAGGAAGARGFFDAIFDGNADSAVGLVDLLFYALTIFVIEPLYVVSGLALYLNRRTQLEGWDIELAFRRMEKRLAGPAVRSLVLVIGAALLVAAGSMLPGHAFAAEAPPAETARDPQAVVKEVLAAPEFREYRKERFWKPKNAAKRETRTPAPSWLQGFIALLSEIARLAAWIAAAVVLVLVLWYARRFLVPDGARDATAGPALPETLFGLDVRPESLPDDPAAAALEHARAGRVREALSLLYRGALVALVHAHAVPLRESSTEGDALVLGRRALPEQGGDYFGRLVEAWQATAYGGRAPAAIVAEKLALAWPVHFGRRGVATGTPGGGSAS